MAESLLWLWFSFHSEVQNNYLGQICYLISWDSSQKPCVIWNCYYKMFCGLKIQDGHHCSSRFNIGPYGKMNKKNFYWETLQEWSFSAYGHLISFHFLLMCGLKIQDGHQYTHFNRTLWGKCFFFSKITDPRKLGRIYLVCFSDKFTFYVSIENHHYLQLQDIKKHNTLWIFFYYLM